jgi:hypothetical protein
MAHRITESPASSRFPLYDEAVRTTVDPDDELLRPDPPSYRTRNGFPVLPASPSAQPVAVEHVNELAAESD